MTSAFFLNFRITVAATYAYFDLCCSLLLGTFEVNLFMDLTQVLKVYDEVIIELARIRGS